MGLTENERIMMKVQICNHHPFWKNKSIDEMKKLDEIEDWILKELFLNSLSI